MKKILSSEVFKYLFFGIVTTLVYMIARILFFSISQDAPLSAILASIVSITFAFFPNDYLVFNQVRTGWIQRFIKFFISRLSTLALDYVLAQLLVKQYPHLIGQFVHDNINMVNAIETLFSQVSIIVVNYIISKLLVFKNKK